MLASGLGDVDSTAFGGGRKAKVGAEAGDDVRGLHRLHRLVEQLLHLPALPDTHTPHSSHQQTGRRIATRDASQEVHVREIHKLRADRAHSIRVRAPYLKVLPMSFLVALVTAHSSLSVRGTPAPHPMSRHSTTAVTSQQTRSHVTALDVTSQQRKHMGHRVREETQPSSRQAM